MRRRRFLHHSLAALLAVGCLSGLPSKAFAAAATPVKVSNVCLGALVQAIGGAAVAVTIDAGLPATHIQIGTQAPVDVTQKLLLKSNGAARARFLDDARNSAPVGSTIKQALAAALPQAQPTIESQHRQWATAFARRVLGWNKAIERKLNARAFAAADRIYLIEWAGGKVTSGGEATPATWSKLPNQPNAPTLVAYESYVDALVAALTAK